MVDGKYEIRCWGLQLQPNKNLKIPGYTPTGYRTIHRYFHRPYLPSLPLLPCPPSFLFLWFPRSGLARCTTLGLVRSSECGVRAGLLVSSFRRSCPPGLGLVVGSRLDRSASSGALPCSLYLWFIRFRCFAPWSLRQRARSSAWWLQIQPNTGQIHYTFEAYNYNPGHASNSNTAKYICIWPLAK